MLKANTIILLAAALSTYSLAEKAAALSKPLPNHNRADGHVVFTHVGQTVSVIQYANIRIPMFVNETMAQLDRLADNMRQLKYHAKSFDSPYDGTLHPSSIDYDAKKLDLIKRRCQTIEDTMLKTTYMEAAVRGKRAAFMATAIIAMVSAAIATSVFSIFTTAELHRMRRNINTLHMAAESALQHDIKFGAHQAELARLTEKTANLTAYNTWKLDTAPFHQYAISMAEQRVHILETVFASVLDGKLNPIIMNEMDIKNVTEGIRHYCLRHQLVPIYGHNSDIFQYDASFVNTDYGFDIYAHIPLMSEGSSRVEDSTMNIYRHIPLPFPIKDDIYLYLQSEMSYIAVSADKTYFKAMRQEDLDDCKAYGTFYACKTGNVVTRSPEYKSFFHNDGPFKPPVKADDLCIWALFYQQYQHAVNLCNTKLADAREKVIQISATEFAVYSPTPHQARMTCQDNRDGRQLAFSANTANIVSIPHGCTAYTKNHRFSPSDTAYTRDAHLWRIHFTWPVNTQSLTHNLDLDAFSKLRKDISSPIANHSSVHLDDALRAVREMNLNPILPEGSLWHLIPLSSLTFIIGTAGLLCSLYALRKISQLPSYHQYTAVPLQPLPFPTTNGTNPGCPPAATININTDQQSASFKPDKFEYNPKTKSINIMS